MRGPLLMIPGPTNVDERVLKALSLPPLGHTSPEFYGEFKELLELTAKTYFTGRENVVVYSGSGTLGMEGVLASIIEPGDKVLALVNGFFAERMASIAEIYGARVRRVRFGFGEPVNPEKVEEFLLKEDFKAVTVSHVETSTGTASDVREVAKIAREHDALAIVDVVSSLGGMPIRFDEYGFDAAFASSQKCIAGPPGATLIALSKRAKEAITGRKSPVRSYYFDLRRWLKVMSDPKIYLATPAIPILRALRVALQILHEEGIENRWRRHRKMAELIREGIEKMGLSIASKSPADTVTAALLDRPMAKKLQNYVYEKHGILIATGIGEMKDRVLRIGHLGLVNEEMVERTLAALKDALDRIG